MGDSTSGDGGIGDPDRVWRRPAPGEPPSEPSTATWAPAGTADDPQRSVWGPEADVGVRADARPAPSSPPTWNPPPAGPAATFVGASGTEHRWEPTVGTPDDGGTWAGPPNAREVGIDERHAPPPRQPGGARFGGWWTRAGIIAAVLAVVLAVIAVASGSGSDGEAATATSVPATSSPPTTGRRTTTTTTAPTTTTEAPSSSDGSTDDVDPADLAPEDDPRVMLTDLPDGFAVTGAQLSLKGSVGGFTPGLFLVTDGSTWFDGPWVQVASAEEASFVGPATTVDVGGRTARLGTSDMGAELVAVDAPGGAVAVSAKGLPPGAASALAAALSIGTDGTWSVPASAVPAGLRLAAGDLADSMTVRAASSASVNYQGPGGVGLTVYSALAEPGYDPLSVAPFFLSDVAYVTIGSEQGVMGTYRGNGFAVRSVQWRHLGVDIEVTSWGIERAELLALAAHASTRADGSWSERTWSAAEDGALSVEEAEPVLVQQAIDFGNDGGGSVVARRNGGVLSWWIDGSTGFTVSRYGQSAPPIVLQVASNAVPAIDPDGTSYVVALALGDASIEGATLRLRSGALVTGAEGNGAEQGNTIHPLGEGADDDAAGAPSEFGYTLGTAAAVPWTEGEFVAELIAADGVTILATATPADLR